MVNSCEEKRNAAEDTGAQRKKKANVIAAVSERKRDATRAVHWGGKWREGSMVGKTEGKRGQVFTARKRD